MERLLRGLADYSQPAIKFFDGIRAFRLVMATVLVF
jgi:hypothetical protein